MHCFNILVQVKSSEQTLFNFLILGKSRFPPKNVLKHELQKNFFPISGNPICEVWGPLRVGERFYPYKNDPTGESVWPDGQIVSSRFGHLQQWKFAQKKQIVSKWVHNFAKYQINL